VGEGLFLFPEFFSLASFPWSPAAFCPRYPFFTGAGLPIDFEFAKARFSGSSPLSLFEVFFTFFLLRRFDGRVNLFSVLFL